MVDTVHASCKLLVSDELIANKTTQHLTFRLATSMQNILEQYFLHILGLIFVSGFYKACIVMMLGFKDIFA